MVRFSQSFEESTARAYSIAIRILMFLDGAEQCYEERDAEIHHEAVENGQDDEPFSGVPGYDRKRSVHGGCTSC